MNAKNLVYGPPVILFKSEQLKPLKHNKTAEEFQNKLQRGSTRKEAPKEKACRECKEVKTLDEFSKHPSMKDGHLNHCKQCQEAKRLNKNKKERERYKKSVTK